MVYTYPGAGSEFGSGDTITLYPSTGYVPPPPPSNNNGGDNGGKGGKGGKVGPDCGAWRRGRRHAALA